MTESTAAPRTPTVVDRVTAVMVCHNGATWLPRALAALDSQERQPDRIVLVDTGSTDSTASLLAERADVRIVRLDQRTGFGSAVSAGLATVSDQHELHDLDPDFSVVDWVWLLHDDCAPEPDALEILVAATEQRESIAVLGPKVRAWTDPRTLCEVGVTIARSGRRETGLEPNEQDQGQHDGERDVLAVGSSGMLVRRTVWDQLGGFDPYLSFFRDDIDFCWRVRAAGHRVVVVTDAVVLHAEAASRGRRDVPGRWSRPHRIDRANAMLVLLTNLRTLSLFIAVPRLVLGSLVRSLGFLLGKEPGVALDELWALAIVLRHPGRIGSARRARKATRIEQQSETQRLLAPRTAQLHHAVETVAGVLSSRRETPSHVLMGADDGSDDLPTAPRRSLRQRLATHPGVGLVSTLTLISIVACRHLFGGGQLLGGALLPAPAGSSDLWQRFAEGWHSVGAGSSMPAPPWLMIVSVTSTPFLGRPGLLLDTFVVALVPLAAWSAYAALSGVVRRPALRVWAAGTYALLPAALGAIATGRIGTMVVAVLLPPLLRMLVRLWPTGRGQVSMRYAWATGLFLAAVASFVPLVWCLAAVVGLFGLLVSALRARALLLARLARQAAALMVAPLVLLPWSWYLVGHPALLLLEPGVADPGLSASHLALGSIVVLRPGGPGMPFWWVCCGLVVGALIAALRRDRARVAPWAWFIVVFGMLAGFVLAVLRVTSPTQGIEVGTWAGIVTLLAGAGAVLAASSSIPRLVRGMTSAGFSWRQPMALIVAAVAVLSPVVIAGEWVVGGAGVPVARTDPNLMPAFIAADLNAQQGTRVLVLRDDGPNSVSYTLANSAYPVLGDIDVSQAAPPQLSAAIADLVSGRADASQRLATFGVTNIVLPPPAEVSTVRALDGSLGVRRVASSGSSMVWTLSSPGALARLVPAGSSGNSIAPTVVLSATSDVSATGTVPSGWTGGTLVVAARAGSQWQAALNGVALEPTVVDGWAQGFVVPLGSAGVVDVGVRAPTRTGWLWAELIAFVIAVCLALPGRRSRSNDGQRRGNTEGAQDA
jgi:GT2 family glycosyltransferase